MKQEDGFKSTEESDQWSNGLLHTARSRDHGTDAVKVAEPPNRKRKRTPHETLRLTEGNKAMADVDLCPRVPSDIAVRIWLSKTNFKRGWPRLSK